MPPIASPLIKPHSVRGFLPDGFAPIAMLLVLIAWTYATPMHAETTASPKWEASAISFPLIDLDGQTHDLRQNDRQQTRAFVFLSTECPIAASYIPTLSRLHQSLATKNVQLFGVVADATLKRTIAAKQFAKYKVSFPVLFDSSFFLADALKPTHISEAFVLDAGGKLVYRGAIDDTWPALGRRKPKAERHYLKDAITETLAGRAPTPKRTKLVGCIFEARDTPASDHESAKVTYTRDIAPIIYTRCMNCHRPGQAAPFSLTSYEQVAKRARQIAWVTEDRIMPPWVPQPSEHKFVGERWLTDRELILLKQWAESGKARGDEADLPPKPTFVEGWQLGKPDLVLKMTEPFTVRADGPDLFQNFVIPIDIPEDKLVAAVEFHPGNKRVVHHAVLFLDSNKAARKLDAATPEPGYSLFGGPGFAPTGALGGWSVGNTARRLPNGMGRYLAKGSDLVMQIHYHPTGKVEVDQSEVGLYFIDKPVAQAVREPAKLVGSIWMANYEMDIPAGKKHYRRTTTYTLPREVIMVGVVPHMHLLGKTMKVTAKRPSGRVDTLVDIKEWNYNWQDEYYFEKPFTLPKGTVLKVEAAFDNSATNPSNPRNPPIRVTWGDGTDDEMLFCFFLLTAKDVGDLIHTIQHNLQHDAKQPRAKLPRRP